MNQKSLQRRLRAAEGWHNLAEQGRGGLYLPPGTMTAREQIQEETERQRDHLAAELLKIVVENGALADDWPRLAGQALAAATVIHPDLPTEEGAADV